MIARFLNQQFHEETETRNQPSEERLVADRFERVLNNFVDIGGYFRAGYGLSDTGGPMVSFQAPGAVSKYRLGNEAENYGELILQKNLYLPGVFHVSEGLRPDGTPRGPIAKVQLRMSFFNPYSDFGSADATSVGLPESWASVGNVFPSAPSIKFWAGNRFYRRHDIHILDFFFWNMSGGGGGVEDIPLGPAKMALAWVGWGSTSGLSYVPQPDPQNSAGFSKSNIDFRIYDLPLLFGQAEIGVTYANAGSGRDESGREAPASNGVAFNFVHTVPELLSRDGTNKLSVQYGTGAARTFTAGFETVTLPEGVFIRPDPTGTSRLRVTENFTANLSDHFSLGPVVVFQLTDNGEDAREYWVSAGARPIIHFSHYISLAFEAGMDWVKDTAKASEGVMGKFTIAPQVSAGSQFLSRPVIRAFFTGAAWSDDFVGQVGGSDNATSNDAFSFGMQMESWW